MRRSIFGGTFLASLLLASLSYGETITVNCKGEGPSLDLARMDADRVCSSSVLLRLDAELSATSTAIESEKDVALHSEVTRSGFYEGLTCKPENERVTETSDQVLVQVTCRYDLDRVKRLTKPRVQGKPRETEKRIVSLATVPYCFDLLIRGETPRVVQCLSNPVRLVLKSGDESVTVRAKGHLPKTVQIGDLRESTDESTFNSTTVYLDPIR